MGVLPVPHGLHGFGDLAACVLLGLDQPDGLSVQQVDMVQLLPRQLEILVAKAGICITVLMRRLGVFLSIIELLADMLRDLFDCSHAALRHATRSMLMMAAVSPTAVTA